MVSPCSLRPKVPIENWGKNYTTVKLHSFLEYKPAASETVVPSNRYLMEGLAPKVVQ
ncbi:MAG: hypothetical protein ABSD38_20110 [Syntrophorhabdales bacterium]